MDTSIVTKESPRATMQEDMADVLTCACCQDLMNDPICLEPCLHAFCKECYTSWEAVQRTWSVISFVFLVQSEVKIKLFNLFSYSVQRVALKSWQKRKT